MKQYLAFDLGASSGRAILGTIDNGKVTLEEMHRFENGPMSINGGLFWNLLGLFNEMKLGLKKTLEAGANLSAIAIDTWGVDSTATRARTMSCRGCSNASPRRKSTN